MQFIHDRKITSLPFIKRILLCLSIIFFLSSWINADGEDLSFITVKATDKDGLIIPDGSNKIIFIIKSLGEIVATDNGDPANLVVFPSKEREAYFGLLLAIVRFEKGKPGTIKITASSKGLKIATIDIKSK